MKRITPLNIITACLLIWLGFGLIDMTLGTAKALWLLLLIVISVIGDQMIRVSVGALKRIWIVQLLFIVVTVAIAFAIWYIKN